MRTHKVGTFTLGIILISFGLLFLLGSFIDSLSYEFIFKLWPIIFIFLGLEILLANFKKDEQVNKLVYDKTAFFLIIILSFFAMGMAIAELGIQYARVHMIYYQFWAIHLPTRKKTGSLQKTSCLFYYYSIIFIELAFYNSSIGIYLFSSTASFSLSLGKTILSRPFLKDA